MIEGLVSGKVYGRPEQRTGKSGRGFVVAKVRAAVGEADAVFVNVLCFSESAQAALLALEDGDAVSLAGTLTPKAWTDKQGAARPALDLVAAQVMTAYGAKKKREAVQAAAGAGGSSEAPRAPGGGADRARPQQRQQPRQHERHDFEAGADDDWLQGGAA